MLRRHCSPDPLRLNLTAGGTLGAFCLLCLSVVSQAAQKDEKPKIPEPENIKLATKDGIQLRCTWYAGTLGKKAVPIIMLHGWGGMRGDYSALATSLQRRGHAVIVPDLRGHGESDGVKVGDREIPLERYGRQELASMINDVEAVKTFLMERNNAGELNIGMLCIVAADATSIVAMNWAIHDWSWPQLTTGKQGQDVKALVLLSPQRSFRGLTAMPALRHPLLSGRGGFTLSVMIIVGKRDRTAMREASTIYNTLQRTRPKVPAGLRGRELYMKKDLYLISPDVEFQGAKLLDPQFKLGLDTQIAGFIHYRLEERQEEPAFRWMDRSPR